MIVTANPAVAVGDKVRILISEYPNYGWIEGAEIEADRSYLEGSSYFLVPGQGHISCTWEIVTPEVHPNRYTMPDSTADMAADIERLKRELEHEKAQHELTLKSNRAMWDDFSKIDDALSAEASDRGWCEDYEKFVLSLNDSMNTFALALPTVDYEVTVQRTRFVYEQVTVTVSGPRASSEYDLQEAAYEEAYNSYDWSETDEDISDDYEVVDMREA
jgi:hypothetical protein